MKRFCFLVLLPALLFAGTISHNLSFAPEDFVFDRGNGFDVVALPGHYTTSEPGEPCLPLALYNFVIPADAEVVGVEVSGVSTRALPGEFDVHPCQRPQAFSLPAQAFVVPDGAVYSSRKPYPAEVARGRDGGKSGRGLRCSARS